MTDSPSALPARLAGLPVHELGGDLRLVEAASFLSRQRGLGGLEVLAPGVALEIRTSAVHTATMRFALDLIWLSADRRVVRVDTGVGRWRVRVCWGAHSVIETTAGQAQGFVAALGARR